MRVKGENKRVHVLVQKEVGKSLAKESQLQHKIEDLDSFTFELDEKVRGVDRKRKADHKHVKHFKQLAHRWLKRSKELLKSSNELGGMNLYLNDESGFLIKALTAQQQILERYCLEISQSQLFSIYLKRKRAVGK